MKKLISILFFIALFLVTSNSALADDTMLLNCSMETIENGTSAMNTCLSHGKTQSDNENCGVAPYFENEVCCCQSRYNYSCSWEPINFENNPVNGKTFSRETICPSGMKEGTDCNPATKPSRNQTVNIANGASSGTEYYCCCGGSDLEKAKFTIPEFQINIGLDLSEAQCTGPDNTGDCYIPWIAQYINFIYNYGLGIGGILAAVVLMAGGLLWLVSGGDVSKITQAKNLITGSITGLMILFGSYILLKQINPNLLSLKPMYLKMIEQIIIEPDSEATTPIILDLESMEEILNVECGTDTVTGIILKSEGKTTYNNPKRGSAGPNNTIYNDCSGFASFVLKCAYNKDAKSYTGDIFAEQTIWDENIESLQEGDLIGWAPTNSEKGMGHVFIYMGNNSFGDCHGGSSGRESGNCVSTNLNITNLQNSAASYSEGKLFIKRY